MSHLSSRIYKDEKDLQTILDLITRSRPPEYFNDYPARMDIEENLASAVTRPNTRLWFDDEQPIAWAFVDEFNNLRWELDPRYEDRLGQEVVEWGEACIRKKSLLEETSSLDTSCREDYTARTSFLKQHGFSKTEETTIAMSCPLDKPISDPVIPPGFFIRPIAGIHEAEAVAALHRLAFGTDYMTTENRLAIMNSSAYDPSLDLVFVAPDRSIAAYCLCSVNPEARKGNADTIATHPHFQRMGLARALLLRGLKMLTERGMRSAHLGTSGKNVVMQKTAESVGFAIEYKILWFSKEVN